MMAKTEFIERVTSLALAEQGGSTDAVVPPIWWTQTVRRGLPRDAHPIGGISIQNGHCLRRWDRTCSENEIFEHVGCDY